MHGVSWRAVRLPFVRLGCGFDADAHEGVCGAVDVYIYFEVQNMVVHTCCECVVDSIAVFVALAELLLDGRVRPEGARDVAACADFDFDATV